MVSVSRRASRVLCRGIIAEGARPAETLVIGISELVCEVRNRRPSVSGGCGEAATAAVLRPVHSVA